MGSPLLKKQTLRNKQRNKKRSVSFAKKQLKSKIKSRSSRSKQRLRRNLRRECQTCPCGTGCKLLLTKAKNYNKIKQKTWSNLSHKTRPTLETQTSQLCEPTCSEINPRKTKTKRLIYFKESRKMKRQNNSNKILKSCKGNMRSV